MNIWKTKDELAKHGRNGDTMMKKIDGDLAHVNAVEYEMSPEYIKEHGAGTINPVTGKKEYVFDPATVSLGLSIGSAIFKGFGAMGAGKDVAAGKAAAYDLYQEQLGLLGEQKGLAGDVAQSQFTAGQRDVSMGTQTGMRGIQESGALAASRSGLATSGTIEQKVKTQRGDLMAKYKSDMTKLFETRDISRAQADLSYRKGEMSAEEAYQSTLTQLEGQPTTFLEGMFG